MGIRRELERLTESDTYSLILFALYKLKDDPSLSTLSELIYVLDKNSLLNLCECFGGLTITIPTIEDLETMIYALLLYNYVNIDKMEYAEAEKLVKSENIQIRQIRNAYDKLCNVLADYEFKKR